MARFYQQIFKRIFKMQVPGLLSKFDNKIQQFCAFQCSLSPSRGLTEITERNTNASQIFNAHLPLQTCNVKFSIAESRNTAGKISRLRFKQANARI